MKRLFFFTLLWLGLAVVGYSQVTPPPPNPQFLQLIEQSSTPATPSSGRARLYFDNTATPLLKYVDDTGTVTTILTGAGSGITGTLTATRVPFASGASTLTDDADMTFATDTLTITKVQTANLNPVAATPTVLTVAASNVFQVKNNAGTITLASFSDTGNISFVAPTGSNINFTPGENGFVQVTGYSLTGSDNDPGFLVSGTWNTSGTPTAIKANITDTASNAGSFLLDLQIGSVSKFNITKAGSLTGVAGTFSGTLTANGGLFTSIVTKVSADSPYTVLSTDYTILCDATSGAITINLPALASSSGRILVMKKVDSSANACTLDGSGAETIDGSATLATTTQWTSFTIQGVAAGWRIL